MPRVPSWAAVTAARAPSGADPSLVRLLLIAGYVAVLLVPLALIHAVVKPGAQGGLVVFADALGFAALSLVVLQVCASGRWAWTTRAFGLRSVLSLHRQAGVAVLVLVVVHVAALVVADPARVQLLDLHTAPPRARAGALGLLGLIALAVTSRWRQRLRLGYERWRVVHLTVTAVVIAAAFAHVVWVDAYTSRGSSPGCGPRIACTGWTITRSR